MNYFLPLDGHWEAFEYMKGVKPSKLFGSIYKG